MPTGDEYCRLHTTRHTLYPQDGLTCRMRDCTCQTCKRVVENLKPTLTPAIIRKYPNQFVAIKDNKVMFHSTDANRVLASIERQKNPEEYVFATTPTR